MSDLRESKKRICNFAVGCLLIVCLWLLRESKKYFLYFHGCNHIKSDSQFEEAHNSHIYSLSRVHVQSRNAKGHWPNVNPINWHSLRATERPPKTEFHQSREHYGHCAQHSNSHLRIGQNNKHRKPPHFSIKEVITFPWDAVFCLNYKLITWNRMFLPFSLMLDLKAFSICCTNTNDTIKY